MDKKDPIQCENGQSDAKSMDCVVQMGQNN